MHNKRTRVLYPKMYMLCSFLSLVTITAISMRALLMKLPHKGLQTRMIFKNARQESPNTRVLCTRVCEVKMSCTVLCVIKICIMYIITNIIFLVVNNSVSRIPLVYPRTPEGLICITYQWLLHLIV